MKKSIKNAITFLAAITVGSFLLYGASLKQPVNGNNKAKIKQAQKPWVVPEKVSAITCPVTPQEGLLATGREIWVTQCKSCHGKKGQGDGVKAEKIDIPVANFTSEKYKKLSDGELYFKATAGRKPMPSFHDELSDIERWCVVMYIRTTFTEN